MWPKQNRFVRTVVSRVQLPLPFPPGNRRDLMLYVSRFMEFNCYRRQQILILGMVHPRHLLHHQRLIKNVYPTTIQIKNINSSC